MIAPISKVVVAYDGSEMSKKALDRAIMLAKQDNHVEIKVLSVVEITPVINNGTTLAARNTMVENAKQMMHEEVISKLKAIPNKTETYVIEGHPPQEIVEFAAENNADLIIMGSRGLSGLKEMFLGSVSHYIAQKTKADVLIVK